uniref:Galectin n=1 Tax=Meloidogyne hapla TaxID=6305 RepID=A0A1I8BKE0_MELHA
MDGDIQPLDFDMKVLKIDPMPYRMYKKRLELKEFGKIICFEGKIPRARNMSIKKYENSKLIQVFLLHGASEYDYEFSDTILRLDFNFDEDLKLKKLSSHPCNAFLYVNSYVRKAGSEQLHGRKDKYVNPIGQAGAPIVMLIYADEYFFRIIINDGTEHILYNYTLPPWAANYVMRNKWLSGLPGKCTKYSNLEEGQRIRLSIYQINGTTIKSDLETEDNLIEMFYNMHLPISMTEYIELKGIDTNEEGFVFKFT